LEPGSQRVIAALVPYRHYATPILPKYPSIIAKEADNKQLCPTDK